MTMKLMALVAASSLAVACGTLTPTTSDDLNTTASGTVTSAAGLVGPRFGPKCAAQGIVLRAARTDMKITAVFVDGLGNPVRPTGCDPLAWSVSPDGAFVVPLSAGPFGALEVELVSVGVFDATVYTVTATS